MASGHLVRAEHAKNEFHAMAGSEVHIWTEPVILDCEDIPIGHGLRVQQPARGDEAAQGFSPSRALRLRFTLGEPAFTLRIEPNPSSSSVTFRSEAVPSELLRLEIHDLNGRLVRLFEPALFPLTLPDGGLAKGEYLARVIGTSLHSEERFIIH